LAFRKAAPEDSGDKEMWTRQKLTIRCQNQVDELVHHETVDKECRHRIRENQAFPYSALKRCPRPAISLPERTKPWPEANISKLQENSKHFAHRSRPNASKMIKSSQIQTRHIPTHPSSFHPAPKRVSQSRFPIKQGHSVRRWYQACIHHPPRAHSGVAKRPY
jgi:hypothetical protein